LPWSGAAVLWKNKEKLTGAAYGSACFLMVFVWRKLPTEEQIRKSIHNPLYIKEIFGEE
jgi:hypothetical protein